MKDKEISAPDDEAKELPKKRHLNVVFIGHVGRLIHFMAFLKDKMLGVRIYSLFWILIFDWPIDVAMVNAGWCVVQDRHPHCGCLDKILFFCLFWGWYLCYGGPHTLANLMLRHEIFSVSLIGSENMFWLYCLE